MGKRIGLIADNHSRTVDGADVPEAVLRAFDGADLILHLGDAGTWGTLDRLSTVAPVIAVLGGHNGADPDTRVRGLTRIEQIEGLRVGMVHDLVGRGAARETLSSLQFNGTPRAALRSLLGSDIDVLAYAGTHDPRIAWVEGILLVNPGSPTLPAGRERGSLGHVAVVEIADGVASARVVDLAG
jgi:putative phosphoesterase